MFNFFSARHLRHDVMGGITAAIVSLPLALTFGVASGAGPEAGLYGAIVIGLFAALFGGTPTLISEPTGPMTVVMAAVVTGLVADNPENGLAMAFTVVMMAGLFQIAFGLLKLGKYITLMPYSVVSGFMSGIGIILIIIQFAPALGLAAPPGGVIGTLRHIPDIVANIQINEVLLTVLTLCILFFTPGRVKKRIPAQLIALIAVSAFSVLALDADSIRRIGEISVSLPVPVLPTFNTEQLQGMVGDAMVLGMLGCIDSMLTSVIADNLTRTEHKSDKELIGQGVGNFFSGLLGGLPGAGATMGTVVNIQTGAHSAWSGVARVATLIIGIFGAASLLESIPLAVLAGIAVKVGIDILDWSFLKRAHRVSWQSTLVMYSVLFLTVFVDLIVAVGIGVFIANILIIEKLSATQSKNVKAISDLDDALPLDAYQRQLLNDAKGRILYFYLSGPMIFGVSKALARERAQIPDHDVVIIDLSDVSMLDDTMSLSIENLVRETREMQKEAILIIKTTAGKQQLVRVLEEYGDDLAQIMVTSRTEALKLGVNKLALKSDNQ